MNPRLITRAALLEPSDITLYLQSLGWTIREHPNQRLFVFERQDNELPPVEFVMPRDPKSSDFAQRVSECLATLGEILHLQPNEVLEKVQTVGMDVIRATCTSHIVTAGTIALPTAAAIVEGLREFVSYAATAEANPLPYHLQLSKAGKTYATHCRFGQTFEGSFGFTVESPIQPNQGLLFNTSAAPFERLVVERLHRGLANAEECVKQESLDPIVTNYKTGLTGNMCDAILAMRKNTRDLAMSYAFDWSPKIAAEGNQRRQPIHIGPEAAEYIEQASTDLKRREPPRVLRVEGLVTQLESDQPPWDDEPTNPHTITVSWQEAPGKLTKTRVVLSLAHYLQAVDAHVSGQTVSILGTFERRGKKTRLADPTEFTLGIKPPKPE